jgi:hypothetical protein
MITDTVAVPLRNAASLTVTVAVCTPGVENV